MITSVTVWTQNRIIRRKTRTWFSTIRCRVTLNGVIYNTFVTPVLLMPKNSNLYCHCSLLKTTNSEEGFTVPLSLFKFSTTWKQLSVSDLTLSLYFLVTCLYCHWNLHSPLSLFTSHPRTWTRVCLYCLTYGTLTLLCSLAITKLFLLTITHLHKHCSYHFTTSNIPSGCWRPAASS